MHFHRDVPAISRFLWAPTCSGRASDDIFIGSPPLAFTFGLGGLVVFPCAAGAASVLIEKTGPNELIAAIERFRPTVLSPRRPPIARSSPRAARPIVEPAALRLGRRDRCRCDLRGLEGRDRHSPDGGIGSTEMLHIFIGSPPEEIRPGATGRPVPGYEAKVLGPDGREAARGTPGDLAVRGPTGCRYLDDPRQTRYVSDGWNLTGDTFIEDKDGYFWFQARSDDMIVSAGYNISGPEVEASLVRPSRRRRMRRRRRAGRRARLDRQGLRRPAGRASSPDAALVRALQDHVKDDIAPYKYPRAIAFRAELPKTRAAKSSARSCARRRKRRGDLRRVERAGTASAANFSLVEFGAFQRIRASKAAKNAGRSAKMLHLGPARLARKPPS